MTRGFWLCVLFLVFTAPAHAADWAWAMSVPHAISDEYIYKLRIVAIDGEPQQELLRYSLSPGRHEITVELLLDLEWEPDLSAGERTPPIKPLEIEVEAGKSYMLAGKVDVNAPAESQLDQSWWEPVIYAVK
jgi:hypothetical protein